MANRVNGMTTFSHLQTLLKSETTPLELLWSWLGSNWVILWGEIALVLIRGRWGGWHRGCRGVRKMERSLRGRIERWSTQFGIKIDRVKDIVRFRAPHRFICHNCFQISIDFLNRDRIDDFKTSMLRLGVQGSQMWQNCDKNCELFMLVLKFFGYISRRRCLRKSHWRSVNRLLLMVWDAFCRVFGWVWCRSGPDWGEPVLEVSGLRIQSMWVNFLGQRWVLMIQGGRRFQLWLLQ